MGWAEQLAAADRAIGENLGRPVTFTPEGGAAATVTGIFHTAYLSAAGSLAGVASGSPAVFLALADLAVDPEDVEATVSIPAFGVAPAAGPFFVTEVQKDPDGVGVLLLLRRGS